MQLKTRADVKLKTPEGLLCFIAQYGDHVVSHVSVNLQVLLTLLPIANGLLVN